MTVRTRFAPSPTGYLHVGGARTALFNWLYAKKMGGEFVLRVEDTDQKRSTPESIQAIFDGMNWLGLDWDEGPGKEVGETKYFQTQRLDIYNRYIDQLLAEGKAYKCYRSKEELEHLRAEAEARGLKGYQREWSELSPGVIAKYEAEGRPHVVRFRAPREGKVTIQDIVHGEVSFNMADMVDDFVIRKQDGIPTYNFAVVIDDATMGITHVLRGDDHLANTPKQVAIYQALGLELPQFGHLPMILGPDKQKLSKRHGATSVIEYDSMGYLPWAMVNYLVRLGWSHGDREIFSKEELIEAFDLEGLGKTAAVFDMKKFTWLNAHYIQQASTEDLIEKGHLIDRLVKMKVPHAKESLEKRGMPWFSEVVSQLKPRSKTLNEMAEAMWYFFDVEMQYEDKAKSKFLTEDNLKMLGELTTVLERVNSERWEAKNIESFINVFASDNGIENMGKLAQPLRVALTGGTVSPGIFETLQLIGREDSLQRLKNLSGMS